MMSGEQTHREAKRYYHRNSNYKPKETPDDGRKNVLAIRRDYWDYGMRLTTVVRKWTDRGCDRQYVEDVIFYRVAPSLQPQDRLL